MKPNDAHRTAVRLATTICLVVLLSAVHGCSKSTGATSAPSPTRTPAAAAKPWEVFGYQGHIKLDPRTDYYAKEGDLFQYFFYQDGALSDVMLCYPHPNRCELVELRRTGASQTWFGALAEDVPGIKPFVLHLQLPPKASWQDAQRLDVSVESPGLGEVGATTLAAVTNPTPPGGLRERLRGEQRLRALYTQITARHAESPPAQRPFPESHAAFPAKPPCEPTTVTDPAAVEWLGVAPPVVLSWSFEVEADAAQGTLRLIARRDVDCKGSIEALVLAAKLDTYGEFQREPIASTTQSSAP